MRAIVVSDEFRGIEHGLVGPAESDAADELADMYLHPALQGRVNGKKRGSVNLGDLAFAPLQILTAGKLSKLLDLIQREDPNAILTKGTTYARVENDLIKLAEQQKKLIHKMANDVNLASGENLMEAVIKQSDKLKGFNRDADPLSGIVGPTQAVYKRYKSELDGIASGKFTQFFEKNGCERLHLFDVTRARTHFTRHGGGDIEKDNVYVLHPKLDGVLVPILSYHKELCIQLDKEVQLALGKLGAKELLIKKSKKSKIKGWLKSRSASARAQGGQNQHRLVEKNWGSPTYDPEHATVGCSLIQTSEWMTLIALLKETDLTVHKEHIEIDTTFNLGVDVVQLIDSSFEWESVSQYHYDAKFFSKEEIDIRAEKAKEDDVQLATRVGSKSG